MREPPARLSYFTWSLAAAFYLFGFFQRITPASLAADLMRDFHLSAAALGNLSAFYYYAYAAMQIPTGLLVDRFGPARLFVAGSALAGAGSLLFALSGSVALAGLGRALIGAAHGMAWVSMLKLVTHWFAPRRFGMLSGLSLAIGTLGAILAGPPLRALADAFGWRAVIAVSSVLVLALSVAIKLFMRDDPLDRNYRSFAPAGARIHAAASTPVLAGLMDVARRRNTWLLAIVNSGTCGAFLAFTGLWGVPFFVQQHALSVKEASTITSAMLVLFALGAPAFGHLSDRWQRRKRPFALGSAMLVAGFAALALFPDASLWLLVPALLAASFGTSSMALSFAYVKESVPAQLQGAATGVANAGVMLGTLIQMPVIGLILDAHWNGAIVDGVRQYDLSAFRPALTFLFAWMAVAFVLLLLTRETNARQTA
ncbi:MAG: MFS transporter [Gemmatimonadota bacterium]